MARAPRSNVEFYRQRFVTPQRLPAAVLLFLWGAVFGSAFQFVSFPLNGVFAVAGYGVALMALYAVARYFADQRYGIFVDDQGLVVRYWLLKEYEYPWSSIQRVRAGLRRALIETRYGPVEIDESLHAWRKLLRRVEARSGRPTSRMPGKAVTQAEIANWLGVHYGGELTLARPGEKPWAGYALLALWPFVTAGLAWMYTHHLMGPGSLAATPGVSGKILTVLHAGLFFGVFSGGLLWSGVRQVTAPRRSLTADGLAIHVVDGLNVKAFAWRDLRDIKHHQGRWWVVTVDGGFEVEHHWPGVDRFMDAVRLALRARHGGRPLP